MDAEAPAPFRASRAFARTRQAPAVLVITLALGLLTLWLGSRPTPFPTAGDDEPVPVWRLLVLGVAVLPATGLHSPLHALEEAAAAPHRRLERRYLWTLWLGCAGLYLTLVLPVADLPLLAVMGRCLLAWSGLALISGRLLGWRLSWVLPLGALMPLLYWGGRLASAWWDFTSQPHDHLPSLALSLTLLAAGALAYEVTFWRRRRRPTKQLREHVPTHP